MVEFDGTVVAIGGYSKDDQSSSLIKLVCSIDECQWTEMSQKLEVARCLFVAMLIPDEMTNCHKKLKEIAK